MTDTVKVLSDDALREIEARAKKYQQLAERAATPADEEVIRWLSKQAATLCATVRALREQLAQYDRERQELWFFLTRRPASQLSHEELIAIHKDMANERDELKDQLAQVTQERDELNRRRQP